MRRRGDTWIDTKPLGQPTMFLVQITVGLGIRDGHWDKECNVTRIEASSGAKNVKSVNKSSLTYRFAEELGGFFDDDVLGTRLRKR
jgi:hypothetical protein